jgi:CHRD domain-containing protein
MSLVRRIAIAFVAAVGLFLAAVVPAAAVEPGVPFTVPLTGGAEVPGPGDPDGSGTATLTVNPGLGQVCYTIEVAGVAPLSAAHIHVAPSTGAGPIVVHLPVEESGGTGCTAVSRELAVAIITDPGSYYVNVHNAEFRAGALRGQLDRTPGL